MIRAMLLGAFFCMIFLGLSQAATIHVPDDYAKIQDAIDASVNGDVIIVRPGTYTENIRFHGKAITLRSEYGPDVTIIDGNQATACVKFWDWETNASILDGFTLRNGDYGEGGGVSCYDASPLIANNIILDCYSYRGGGICGYDSSPIIINNIISNNTALFWGGGIHLEGSDANLTNNTVIGNSAADRAGGIIIRDSTLTISNTILWGNSAQVGKELWVGEYFDLSIVTINHSNVEGGQSSAYVDLGSKLKWESGMIDSDPLLVDSGNNDCHLTWNSPCRNAGDNSAVTEPSDFESDPRICGSCVDMGADEFHFHLYSIGEVVPGGQTSLRFIGPPGAWVILGTGPGIQDPPYPSPFGPIHIARPWTTYNLRVIPSDGVIRVPATVPGTWVSGSKHYFQALVSKSITMATNLMTLAVE